MELKWSKDVSMKVEYNKSISNTVEEHWDVSASVVMTVSIIQ